MSPRIFWTTLFFMSITQSSFAEIGSVDNEFKLPQMTQVEKNESVYSSEIGEEKIFKNINQGDHEINPGLGFGYSSFSGLILQTSLSYRYFFFDDLSFGVMAEGLFSQINREYGLGATGRWYFYETDKWAYSLTQDIYYMEYDFKGTRFRGDLSEWKGKTGLRAHYFFTPTVNLNFGIEYDYSLYPSDAGAIEPSIDTSVGVGFNF